MRHLKTKKKLKRTKGQREALLKTLANSLILKEKITTTEAKAKSLSRFIEPKIEKSKINQLSNIRYLARFFPKEIVKKMINEIGPRYKDRNGGYTRIIKIGQRKDGSLMVKIELV